MDSTTTPYSVITDDRLNLNTREAVMYDWGHITCQDGTGDKEFGMCFRAMSRSRTSLRDLGTYVKAWTHPGNNGSLDHLFTPENVRIK